MDVPYKYTGKELDSTTGLYYYEARYYDPTLGRFISADTIVPNPRDPQDLNRYTYVGNNPFRYTDPTGNFKLKRFLNKTLGDAGITALGLAIQIFGGPVLSAILPATCGVLNGCGAVAGGAVLTQSRSGRYVLAGEILVGTAVTAFACPACSAGVVAAAKGAFAGEVITGGFGGYSAAQSGGDISQGVLFGVAAGGLAGGVSGYISWAFPASTLGKFTMTADHLLDLGAFVGTHTMAGAGVGAASGATTGYAGGAGNWEAILTGSYRGAAIGAAIGAVLAGAEYGFRGTPNYFDIRRYQHPGVVDKLPTLLQAAGRNGVLALLESSALAVGTGLELTHGTLSRLVEALIERELRKGVNAHCSVSSGGSTNCGSGLP